jgi:pimeloyl-ACP methyl ester carboxylesterase
MLGGAGMAKPKIRDLVVVLPGITGSILEKDGRDLWAFSGSALWNTLMTVGSSLESLELDDPEADDGVRATGLIDGIHLIPGLVKIDGYRGLTRMIQREFEVVPGSLESDRPANYFEFPYDWRRDNRGHARDLDLLVKERLAIWRDATNNPDAKTILLAHSMGGLISRYYCEVLGGWELCRALITFGTPHRGSPNALNFLANGYKKLFVDLTTSLRSFPSAYQLLPIYPLVEDDGGIRRVAEMQITGIDGDLAQEALLFHREIEAAVTTNSTDPSYARFTTLPFVGTRQPTLQSATWKDGKLVSKRIVPKGVDPLLADGDGTVPCLSAIPIELSEEYRDTFVPERHSGLHNHRGVLQHIRERLVQMQAKGLGAIRGPTPSDAGERPALSVDLEDVYEPDESVVITATVVNGHTDQVLAKVTPLAERGHPIERLFEEDEQGFRLDLTGVEPGGYRMEVTAKEQGPGSPSPIHDVFVIAHG